VAVEGGNIPRHVKRKGNCPGELSGEMCPGEMPDLFPDDRPLGSMHTLPRVLAVGSSQPIFLAK